MGFLSPAPQSMSRLSRSTAAATVAVAASGRVSSSSSNSSAGDCDGAAGSRGRQQSERVTAVMGHGLSLTSIVESKPSQLRPLAVHPVVRSWPV